MERQLTIVRSAGGTVVVRLNGRFRMDGGLAATDALDRALEEHPPPRRVVFDATALMEWDSTLVATLARIVASCARRGVEVDTNALPIGARRLLGLVESAPAARARPKKERASWVARVGDLVLGLAQRSLRMLAFVGRTWLSLGRFSVGRARCRREDIVPELDLQDLDHNVADGLHMASLAGAWIAFVAGFGGMRDQGGALAFAPKLPDGLTRYSFSVLHRKRCLHVDVTASRVEYTLRTAGSLPITHYGEALTVSAEAPAVRPIPKVAPREPPRQPPGRGPRRRSPG